MKLAPLLVVALVALGRSAVLVCPRTRYTGNYLNYLQLFFQNDDDILSFGNTNTKILKMWESIGFNSDYSTTDAKDRMNAFLVQDKGPNSHLRVYLYMVWVVMNPDDTLKRIISFGRFEIDPAQLDPDVQPPVPGADPSMINVLMRMFFNTDLDAVVIPATKYNNVQRLCMNAYPWGTPVANPVRYEICAPTAIFGFPVLTALPDNCGSGAKLLGTCTCTVFPDKWPDCTQFELAARTDTTASIAQTNALNPARDINVERASTFLSTATPPSVSIWSDGAQVFSTVAPIDVSTIQNCNPDLMKFEYDHFYYMFANYYKNGLGLIAPNMVNY